MWSADAGLLRWKLSNAALVLASALLWFTLHTVPVSKHNIFHLVLVLSLFFLIMAPNLSRPIALLILFGLSLAALVWILSSLASFAGGGRIDHFRDGFVTFLIFGLGFFLGLASRDNRLITGMGFGSLLIVGQGLAAQLLNPSRQLLSGSYVGSTGRESAEVLASIIAVSIGLSMIGFWRGKWIWPGLIVLINVAVIVRINVTGAFLALAVMGLLFLLDRLVPVKSSKARSWRPSLRRLMLIIPIVGVGFLIALQTFVLRLADALGARESVEIRYSIWNVSWENATTLGKILGHGNTFWAEGSLTESNIARDFAALDLPAFGHAHSMYLELILTFGIVGTGIIAITTFATYWKASGILAQEGKGEPSSIPWLLLPALAVFGFGESALLILPIGWFISGFVLGMLAFLAKNISKDETNGLLGRA